MSRAAGGGGGSAGGRADAPQLQPRRGLRLAGALLALAAAFVWLDASRLLAQPFAVGLDGYYYVLQVETLSAGGRPYFPTATPLTLYLLTAIHRLGADAALAVKLGSLCLHAALCAGVLMLVFAATRSAPLGALGAALAAASGAHAYMVVEFINQLGALAFLTWCGWFALRALETRRRAHAWAALACLSAALLSHRSASALALLVGACALASHFLAHGRDPAGKYRRVVLPALALLWSAPALLALQPFFDLPARLATELRWRPAWPFVKAAAPEQLVLLAAAPVALWLILTRRPPAPGRAAAAVFGSAALWAMLVTLNPFLNNQNELGVSWRLRALAYVQVALLVPGLVWFASGRRRALALLVAASAAAPVLWSAWHTRPAGARPEYLETRAQLLRHLPGQRGRLGPSPLVISQHGEEFVVTWALGVPSQQRRPEEGGPESIYWLLHGLHAGSAPPSVVVLATEAGGGQLVLAADEDLRRYLASATPGERARLAGRNRHLLEYMLRPARASSPRAGS